MSNTLPGFVEIQHLQTGDRIETVRGRRLVIEKNWDGTEDGIVTIQTVRACDLADVETHRWFPGMLFRRLA